MPVTIQPGKARTRQRTPQKAAGIRSEPPRSEPVASHAVPEASAAAAPPATPTRSCTLANMPVQAAKMMRRREEGGRWWEKRNRRMDGS